MISLIIGVLVIVLIVIIIISIIKVSSTLSSDNQDYSWIFESPARRVGRMGEQKAAQIIRSVLKEGDRLFTNIQVEYEDKPAELDNVVVNKYGVFIIEVKNYTGKLVGTEEDYEWIKYHITDAGNTYSKTVKNPIRQVKRQVYVLAKYLEYYGTVRVWIEGYAFLLQGNSPVKSKYILSSVREIDQAIHTSEQNRLTGREMEEITKLLS